LHRPGALASLKYGLLLHGVASGGKVLIGRMADQSGLLL
jgi:hypothetical protein